VIIAAIVGGTVASYRLSQSAERESNIAIDTFDLHGDLRQLAGDLHLPRVDRTAGVESDIASAIAGGRQAIGGLRAEGALSPLLVRAIDESATYLEFAQRAIAPTQSVAATTGARASVAAADAMGDLVDRAATQAEQSAHREALDGRIGGIAVLLLVVAFVGFGLLLRARQRRRDAVSATQAEARAQFEAMVEHSSDLFFLTGNDNRTQYCSPSAARFFGMTAEQVCAAPLEQFVHPGDLGQASDAFMTAHATGVVGPLDIRVRHGDGGWRTLEVTANDLSLVSEIQGIAWHTRDVTDRRALEEQLAPSGVRRFAHGTRESSALSRPPWPCSRPRG
jgi:PAS domain S-box-containing protein